MFTLSAGEGIELRQVRIGDADAYWDAVERDRGYLRTWLPWVDHSHAIDDVLAFIARATDQFEARMGPNLGIWCGDKLAGSVGVHPIDWSNRNCAIGYWLASENQGKGLMTRCCRVLINYLFDEMALHRLEIRCGVGNVQSCAIPQRLGFTREGVAREGQWVNDRWVDLVVWSMIDTDWQVWRNSAPAHRG